MWVILLTPLRRIFKFASVSITLDIIICTDLVLPSCDSAGREGGICIGNPRRLINRSGAAAWELARGSASPRRATGSLPHDVDAASRRRPAAQCPANTLLPRI